MMKWWQMNSYIFLHLFLSFLESMTCIIYVLNAYRWEYIYITIWRLDTHVLLDILIYIDTFTIIIRHTLLLQIVPGIPDYIWLDKCSIR